LADAVISEGATRGKLYELAWTSVVDIAPIMGAAAEVRDRAFGPRITYSRKVFIPV
jgi:FO synthase